MFPNHRKNFCQEPEIKCFFKCWGFIKIRDRGVGLVGKSGNI